MKIAIAQLNPTIGDLSGNAQRILEAARQAAEQGAQLVLTPELSLCGYPPRDLLMHPGFVETMAATLRQLAIDLPPQLAVLVGTVEINSNSLLEGGKPLFNSMALLEGGRLQQIFHKRLLPTYDVFDEDRYFEPGKQPNQFVLRDEGGGMRDENSTNLSSLIPHPSSLHIGVTICEDLWNDEEFWGKRSYQINPIADLARQGVDLIINLSASPYTVGKQKLREAMLKHCAVRFNQPVIYANQVGGNDDLIFDGSSVAFNRQGELVCRAQAFASDLVFVELQNGDLQPGTVATSPEGPDAEIWSALVLGVRDYARKCGFSKVVVGLSGGIDSALVAAIAAEAIGPENVLGVLMPSPYSSDHSVKDALALAKNIGIQTQTLSIGELMQGYDHTLEALFAGTEFGLAEENIQSRIRGNLLMAISNKFGHLLLSTGNKSEMAVGYCTLYGDMNGGLAAIADVPKTRVYSICQWLNERMRAEGGGMKEGMRAEGGGMKEELDSSLIPHPSSLEVIPSNILTKAPSAELKPGQVDQDSLPPYEILDEILDRFILEHQTPDQIIAAGHDSQVVNKVVKLISRAEFKRRQAPPVLKVTDRAFGMGWRMPIANRWIPEALQQ
ncbi:NAD+ synthase [Kovacikia minuta CCNUW1]|uniref:NAD+ synthase n=1 Tax=Kovacikia minuta TaxID=2931930 RepID=UPI001CCB9315|nr:NAD+ synthase [Kovacikia minuta]UBF24096.1 NAD+ synthase [Kovacikia minuta CCNUW1]